MKLLSVLLLPLLCGMPAVLPAQAETAHPVAHFDRRFYLTGETVWFKIYLPTHLQNQQFTVRFQLFDEKGNSRATSFLPVNGQATCSGYYQIPFDFESGIYRFHYSALESTGDVVDFLTAEIPVFNDLAPMPPLLNISARMTYSYSLLNDLSVKIELKNNAPPKPGEPVSLDISTTDKTGKPVAAIASVSVTDDELTGRNVLNSPTIFIGNLIADESKFLSGLFKIGTVLLKNGKPLATPLLAVIDHETGKIHFTKSNSEGRFLLLLPPFSGEHSFQFLEQNGRPISIIWEEKNLPALTENRLQFRPEIAEILRHSRERKKIYQLFSAVEPGPIFEKTVLEKQEFEASKSFEVQNFEHFPDMATFFREVVWMLKMSDRKDKFSATLYNTSTKEYFENPPLFLLDGRATFDADFIARLDPATIRRVDLMTDFGPLREAFPGIGGGGVVKLTSLKTAQNLPADAQKAIFSLPGMAFSARFPETGAEEKGPVLRPLVFWKPDFSTDENGKTTLHFIQSDDRSRFVVEVVARSADGKIGRGQAVYSVD